MVEMLKVFGASENNLKLVDLELPLGVMTAITGPSGSGKSSLIDGILYPVLARRLHRAKVRPGRHEKVEGLRFIDKVIRVDQSPLGNTPSSNPATYTGAFDHIRALFAELPDAAERRFTARTFSFNVSGGRCETCEGSGSIKIEMHFLADVFVPCEECNSQRYNEDVLEVKLHGKSIADVLEMPCGEAVELFASYPKILRIVQTLCDVGLDYVTLGQSAPTLSGGEAQRVKLAAELARPVTGKTLYLLDEPTTGLHFDDIEKLLGVTQRLVDLGNTVVVIEHNLDVIKCVDWVIDMGPGAGVSGGEIVFEGTPEQLASSAKVTRSAKKRHAPVQGISVTASYLKEAIDNSVENDLVVEGSAINKTTKPSLNQDETKTSVTKRVAISNDPGTDEIDSVEDEPVTGVVTDPWQVLGRRWHSLGKGFPDGEQPQWPLEIADATMKLIESVAGGDSLRFDSPKIVTVKIKGANDAWATIETKSPNALKVTLAGPPEAIDEDDLPALRIDRPKARGKHTKITLNLTEAKQVRSRKLKSFLKRHLAASVE
jgi:excinuclease ABC subunit A